ncbi:MAG: hypothetical protein QF578_12575 [Alphaproteobacteria bacterium]|jgi:hypothetical protein|nr:hypothetical protein [Alphaproteobacteria bacterium]MDP6813672.1 hypothetical protein [Alphaproteobacteria bacterium]
MSALFSPQYALLWAAVLAAALWLPLRQLIWVLSVRRAQKKGEAADETAQSRLRRRAGITAALLALVFAIFYTDYLFGSAP